MVTYWYMKQLVRQSGQAWVRIPLISLLCGNTAILSVNAIHSTAATRCNINGSYFSFGGASSGSIVLKLRKNSKGLDKLPAENSVFIVMKLIPGHCILLNKPVKRKKILTLTWPPSTEIIICIKIDIFTAETWIQCIIITWKSLPLFHKLNQEKQSYNHLIQTKPNFTEGMNSIEHNFMEHLKVVTTSRWTHLHWLQVLMKLSIAQDSWEYKKFLLCHLVLDPV